MSDERRKTDKLIWWMLTGAFSVIILGGGAWASNINTKVEKIANLETSVMFMRQDISDIKLILQRWSEGIYGAH